MNKKRLLSLSVFFCLSCNLFATNHALEKELYTLRDPQTKRAAFRASMKRVGEFLALEIAKELSSAEKKITTVMQTEAVHHIVDEEIVILTILRAGLPLMDGLLAVFPDAEAGFFAMKRDERTLESTVFYQGIPHLEGKTVIICDPMIATGGSMSHAVDYVGSFKPKKIIVVGAFAVKEGLEVLKKRRPDLQIYTAVVDPVLTDIGYISPGLGDAGDRAFGVKVD